MSVAGHIGILLFLISQEKHGDAAVAQFPNGENRIGVESVGFVSQPRRAAFGKFYPPQDLLNCEGANFSGSWRDFRLRVLSNAKAGFPKDAELFRSAVAVVKENEEHALPGSLKFPQVLLRQAHVTKLEGFCIYGYATALFLLFRHTLQLQHLLAMEQLMGWAEWPLDFSESSDWPTLWRLAPLHLEQARRREGETSWSSELPQEAWADDAALLPRPRLREVSGLLLRWLRGLGAGTGSAWWREHGAELGRGHEEPEMEQWAAAGSWEQEQRAESALGRELRGLCLERQRSRDAAWAASTSAGNGLFPPPGHGLRPAPGPGQGPGWGAEAAEAALPPPKLGIWVLGHHLGSSFEPFSMVQRALRVGAQQEVLASFSGQRHPKPGLVCREFGYCERNGDLEDWFRRYESHWLGDYDWMPQGWEEASSTLATILRTSSFRPRTDLVICGGPAWFCAMLRLVWPMPMLLYFAWPLVPLVPVAFRTHVLALVRSMGQTLWPPTAFVAANWVLAAQFALQVQLLVPVQRPHGIYVNQSYVPRATPEGRARVVVTRVGQWARTGGVALLELTWSFLEQWRREQGRRFPFELTFLSIRIRKTDTNQALTYADFAGFYACIFWPWDVMMLLFNELYTMTMPLLLPEPRWMHHLMVHALRHTEVNWWHLRAGVQGGLPFVRQPDFPLPHLPWAQEAGLAEAAFWYELTDFVQFPHVTTFGSLPSMLLQLRTLDTATVRNGMAAFNRATFRSSLGLYRELLLHLLSS